MTEQVTGGLNVPRNETFWKRLLWKLPYKIIAGDCPDNKGPLMIRFFLFGGSKKASLLLHCFLRSDINRAVHDHPWSFITLPLQSYIEHLPDGTAHVRRAFRPLYRPAEWQHWVEVTRPRTWTLCFKFRTRRDWGFIMKDGWVKWDSFDYRENCE